MLYALHGDAHAARASGDGAHRCVHVGSRQIRHLGCCDLFRLLAGQLTHLVGMRRFTALLYTGGLLDQNARRRGFHDEGETLVRKSGDHHRNWQARFNALGLRVERLAEFHNIQTALTQCGTYRRTWICLTSRHLQLDITDDFLCHVTTPFQWVKRIPLLLRYAPRLIQRRGKRKGERGVFSPSPLYLLPSRLGLFYLAEIQLHRCRTTKDGHRHADFILVVINVFYRTIKISKRAVFNPHQLTHLEQYLGPRFFNSRLHLPHDVLHFFFTDRRGLHRRATQETSHLGRALYQVPAFVCHFHLDQHVTGKKLAFGNALLSGFQLHHFFDWDQNLTKFILHTIALNALGQCTLHAFLKLRVCMNNIPMHGHHSPRPIILFTTIIRLASTAHRNNAMVTANAITTAVVCNVSLRVG